MNGRLLIAGGYGVVGRRLAAPPIGTRVAYLFPSSDVVSFPKTLGVTRQVGVTRWIRSGSRRSSECWLGPESFARCEADGINRAIVLAEFCRALYDRRVNRMGVSFSEEVIDPDEFFGRLRAYGFESRGSLDPQPASA